MIELPLNKLVEKAERLLKSRRVEALGGGTYNVVGDHGTYIVVQNYDGRVSCNCLGFLRKERCSHSTAVLMLANSSRKRRPKRSKD
ncbi:MAG: hypothetical protein JSW19_01680 [Candidatus Bathyarchaeota archaeon]|nr:MAG: hypothetical protein JSW19_01680 [Candidatus Bathyarchaeota archaeon]